MNNNDIFANPIHDWVFEHLVEDTEIVQSLVSSFLNLDCSENFRVLDPKLPDQNKLYQTGKRLIQNYVDVFCETSKYYVIVEMQNRNEEYFMFRAQYYMARILNSQIQEGKGSQYHLYTKPVYLLVIANNYIYDKKYFQDSKKKFYAYQFKSQNIFKQSKIKIPFNLFKQSFVILPIFVEIQENQKQQQLYEAVNHQIESNDKIELKRRVKSSYYQKSARLEAKKNQLAKQKLNVKPSILCEKQESQKKQQLNEDVNYQNEANDEKEQKSKVKSLNSKSKQIIEDEEDPMKKNQLAKENLNAKLPNLCETQENQKKQQLNESKNHKNQSNDEKEEESKVKSSKNKKQAKLEIKRNHQTKENQNERPLKLCETQEIQKKLKLNEDVNHQSESNDEIEQKRKMKSFNSKSKQLISSEEDLEDLKRRQTEAEMKKNHQTKEKQNVRPLTLCETQEIQKKLKLNEDVNHQSESNDEIEQKRKMKSFNSKSKQIISNEEDFEDLMRKQTKGEMREKKLEKQQQKLIQQFEKQQKKIIKEKNQNLKEEWLVFLTQCSQQKEIPNFVSEIIQKAYRRMELMENSPLEETIVGINKLNYEQYLCDAQMAENELRELKEKTQRAEEEKILLQEQLKEEKNKVNEEKNKVKQQKKNLRESIKNVYKIFGNFDQLVTFFPQLTRDEIHKIINSQETEIETE